MPDAGQGSVIAAAGDSASMGMQIRGHAAVPMASIASGRASEASGAVADTGTGMTCAVPAIIGVAGSTRYISNRIRLSAILFT